MDLLMREELLKGLTKEQIEKAKGCKTQVEFLALAKEEGVELTDEQLKAVNGGCGEALTAPKCPRCLNTNITDKGNGNYVCNDCKYEWSVNNLY